MKKTTDKANQYLISINMKQLSESKLEKEQWRLLIQNWDLIVNEFGSLNKEDNCMKKNAGESTK